MFALSTITSNSGLGIKQRHTCENGLRIEHIVVMWLGFREESSVSGSFSDYGAIISILYLTNDCQKQKCYKLHHILWESVTCFSKKSHYFGISSTNLVINKYIIVLNEYDAGQWMIVIKKYIIVLNEYDAGQWMMVIKKYIIVLNEYDAGQWMMVIRSTSLCWMSTMQGSEWWW